MDKIVKYIISLWLLLFMFNSLPVMANEMPVFSVENINTVSGDTVEVKINVKNNPGIASIKLKSEFDENNLTLNSIEYNESIGGNFMEPQTYDSPVTMNWFNGLENSEGDWWFAKLTFSIAEDAEVKKYPITISYEADNVYNISEQNIEFKIENGSVTVEEKGPQTVEVLFDSNGGNAIDEDRKDVAYGEKYGALPTATRDGYRFLGWYTQRVDGIRIAEDTYVSEAGMHTLYACWEKISVITDCTIKLSTTSVSYTGSYIKPTVKVSDNGVALRENKDYKVSYSNNKYIGTAKVTIAGIGDYEGTVTKTFKITAPKGKTYTVSGIKYKITNADTDGTGTVSVTGASKKTITSLSINSSVTIGKCKYKVTSIAEKAFKGYTKLKKVSISSNVTTINSSAFNGCSALTTVKGCTKVTKIGTYAFYNCKKLTRVGGYTGKVTLPAVKTIGSYAFKKCTALTYVNLSSKQLTSIGASAFYGCTKLKTVKIESTKLTSLGKYCFYKCKNLSSVTIKGTKLTKSNVGSNAFKGIKSNCTFKVPKSKVSSYKTVLKARGASSKITIRKY